MRDSSLHTVCEEAHCPNLAECFSRRTATFLILGDHCTRSCRFCAVRKGPPERPSPEEPRRVADVVAALHLRHVVITSVTRDDLPDGGAGQFAETIRQVHLRAPGVQVEVLIPDLKGSEEALGRVLEAGPDVLNHNIETVPRLYPIVRPDAEYRRSLWVLARALSLRPDVVTKSGLMLGMGERQDEVRRTLEDLRDSGCQILTLGQYLRPSPAHHPIERFVFPDEFEAWGREAEVLGFLGVASNPFVRSSYRAGELYLSARDGIGPAAGGLQDPTKTAPFANS